MGQIEPHLSILGCLAFASFPSYSRTMYLLKLFFLYFMFRTLWGKGGGARGWGRQWGGLAGIEPWQARGKGPQVLYSGCALESPGGRLSNTALWAPARTGSITHSAECKTHVWGPFKEEEKTTIKATEIECFFLSVVLSWCFPLAI